MKKMFLILSFLLISISGCDKKEETSTTSTSAVETSTVETPVAETAKPMHTTPTK